MNQTSLFENARRNAEDRDADIRARDEGRTSWTTGQMRTALRTRFSPPAYAYFDEMADGTGSQKNRTADALVMSVWPSRGLELIGIEIKVSRADWTKELKTPAKSDRWVSYCDRWYLAAGDPGILAPGELPPTWGLMAPKGERLCVITEAPQLQPKPVSRALLAAILRRASEVQPEVTAVAEAVQARLETEKAMWESSRGHEMTRLRNRHEELLKCIREFEEASGVRIDTWRPGDIGAAVRLFRDGGVERHEQRLRNTLETAKEVQAALEVALGECLACGKMKPCE